MNTKTKTLTAVAVVLATIPAIGWAQQAGQMRGQAPQIDFAVADADASGGISAEEWSAYVTAQMTERRAAMIGERVDALIAAGDADGDAALNRDELIAGFTTMREERREMRGHERGEMRGHGARGGDRDGARHGARGGDRDGYRDDARGGDRDGYRGEMRGDDSGERMNRFFDRVDQNDDGQISADELGEMQERMERRMNRQNNRGNN